MASSNDTPIVQPEQPQTPEQPTAAPEQPTAAPEQPTAAPDAPELTINSISSISEGGIPVYVQVRPGDTWETLAEAADTTVDALYALNADLSYFSERSVQVGTVVRVA